LINISFVHQTLAILSRIFLISLCGAGPLFEEQFLFIFQMKKCVGTYIRQGPPIFLPYAHRRTSIVETKYRILSQPSTKTLNAGVQKSNEPGVILLPTIIKVSVPL
jgi:hypothetical protein